ncbi:MAG: hypothetical protein H6742_04080 [Alphaproteobacteria bacterium]|nr:hypothetical protein [Alphaproteobacteria bacterium]
MRTPFTLTLPLSLTLALGLAACQDDPAKGDSGMPGDGGTESRHSTLRGAVSDQSGTQSLTTGGSGAAEAAATVEVWTTVSGAPQMIGESEVDADGRFEVEALADVDDVRVVALDGGGAIVGSVLVGNTGAEGETVTVAPITSETSVEAEIYVRARVEADLEAHEYDAVSMSEVMARVDAEVATAVHGYEESTGDADAALDALAEAMLALHASQRTWAEGEGATLSHAAQDEAMAAATAELYAELYAEATGEGDADAAHEAWSDAWADAWATQGLDLSARTELESVVGLTSRAVLIDLLGGRTEGDAVIEAWILASGRREARRVGANAEAVAEAAFGTALDLSLLTDLGADLEGDAEAASDVSSMSTAFDTYAGALVGADLLDDSLIAAMLGLSAAYDGEGLLSACDGHAADAEAELMTLLSAQAGDDLDAEVVGEAAVAAWSDFERDVEAEIVGSGSTATDVQLDATTEIMAQASGSFRGTYTGLW